MNLNLLLNIEDLRWQNPTVDHSKCLDNFGELLEVLIDEEDISWHHPDVYALCYNWGCMHDFAYAYDFPTAREKTGGWLKKRHYDTFRKLWNYCLNQSSIPYCYSVADMDAHPDHTLKFNALLSCINMTSNCVNSVESRHEQLILQCQNNNDIIDWENSSHPFLPNLQYSNEYIASRLCADFDTDYKAKKEQIEKFSKSYCDGKYTVDTKNGAKEGNADTVGSEIARRNFYKYEPEITRKEERLRGRSMRKIFSLSKKGEATYLSIDFEKGVCFELCNAKGEHQGEFRFDGLENDKKGKTKDASGEHDIWALR